MISFVILTRSHRSQVCQHWNGVISMQICMYSKLAKNVQKLSIFWRCKSKNFGMSWSKDLGNKTWSTFSGRNMNGGSWNPPLKYEMVGPSMQISMPQYFEWALEQRYFPKTKALQKQGCFEFNNTWICTMGKWETTVW